MKKFKPLLPESRYILPICFVVLSILFSFNTLALVFLSNRVSALSQRKSSFVQLTDGEVVSSSEQDEHYRHPEVIKGAVRDWLNLTFVWDGLIYDSQKVDPGYTFDNSNKVTTNAYFGSFLLSSNFRKEVLTFVSDLIPPQVFTGQTRSTILIQYVSPPRQIQNNTWEIDVIATRVVANLGGGDQEMPFNKTFTLRTTDQSKSLVSRTKTGGSEFQHRINQIRASGLEITQIEDYNRG